jgi:hypothetical protein
MQERGAGQAMSVPWARELKAVSIEDPSLLVQTLTGAVLGGGWVLSRGANDTGMVSLLFEFEPQARVGHIQPVDCSGRKTEPERAHSLH